MGICVVHRGAAPAQVGGFPARVSGVHCCDKASVKTERTDHSRVILARKSDGAMRWNSWSIHSGPSEMSILMSILSVLWPRCRSP